MTGGLSVPAFETGVIRLFAPQADDPALAAILPPHPLDAAHLAPLLGVDRLREDMADRIALRDLGDYTLTEFLRIAHDIRLADLAPQQDSLDALTGHLVILHSAAFEGAAVSLHPVPGLHFLGAFHRNDAPPAPLSLPEAERPEILTPPPAPPARPGRSRWGLAILALLLLVLLFERLLA